MSDLLDRAMQCFFEVCNLDQEAQRLRLNEIRHEDEKLADKLEQLLRGDRSAGKIPDESVVHLILGGNALVTSPSDSIGTKVSNRYLLQEKLGEGGMATVFRARAMRKGRDVALKVMKAMLSETSRRRFAREFQAVASLDHPKCIKVYEFDDSADFPFFTMELFPGEPITKLSGEPLPRILAALHDAAQAIEYVHNRGIIHRDIKPSNLLVLPHGESAEVRLTDFGIARFYGGLSSLTADASLVGTLQYCAPEQVTNDAIDHRVDLYAFGLVCYETISGRYPFATAREAGVLAIIRAQLTTQPPPLRELCPELSCDLDILIRQMISKDRAERPASVRQLRQALASDTSTGTGFVVDRSSDAGQGRALLQPPFVARTEELVGLDRLLGRVLGTEETSTHQGSPTPPVIFLTGEAGIGKSRMLQEVARLARGHGASVYEGRCLEGGPASYQPFVEVLQRMLIEVSTSPAGSPSESHALPQARLRNLVEHFSPELLCIAPELRSRLTGHAFEQVDLGRELNYVLRAVATFFVSASELHKTCMLLEDLHWADRGTLDLLRSLVNALAQASGTGAHGDGVHGGLVVCCTARSGNIAVQRFIQEVRDKQRAAVVDLNPLTVEQTRDLVGCLLRCDPEELSPGLIALVFQRSKGNPFFACESVRSWQAAGTMIWREGMWGLGDLASSPVALAPSIRSVLHDRLDALTSTARKVLGVCAVIGSIIDVDVLSPSLPELGNDDLLEALEELLARKILVEKGNTLLVEFAHDLFREIAYEDLSAGRRATLHRSVGDVLVGRRASDPAITAEVLAGHFHSGGQRDKAYQYHLEAGEAALAAFAADDAIRLLSRARELAPPNMTHQQRWRMLDTLATAHAGAGDASSAIRCHRESLQTLDDPLSRARTLERVGELRFRIGEFDASVDALDSALKAIGGRRPNHPVAAIASAALSYGQCLIPGVLPLRRRFRGEERQRAIIALGIFNQLTLLWGTRSPVRVAQSWGRQLLLSLCLGDPEQLAYVFAQHAIFLGLFSFNRLAMRVGNRAIQYATEAEREMPLAVARGYLGCNYYFASRLVEAESLLRQALQVLDRRGDSWFRVFFNHNLRHLQSVRGDAEKELRYARTELEISEAAHDSEGTYYGEYGIANALARTGAHDEATEYMERAVSRMDQPNIMAIPTALQTYGFVHLQAGRYQAAVKVLDEARRIIEKNLAYVDYSIRTYPLLVEAMLGPDWSDPGKVDPSLGRRCWRLGRWAQFWGKRFPNYLPHALRVRGRAAFALGNTARAIDLFRKSVRSAQAIGAIYDEGRAWIDLATVANDPKAWDEGKKTLGVVKGVVPECEVDRAAWAAEAADL